MAFKMRKSDLELLNKAVHAKNEKIRYTETVKKIVMEDKTSYAQLKNSISSRAEFNKTINALQTFGKTKIPEPVIVGNGVKIHPDVFKTMNSQIDKITKTREQKKTEYGIEEATSRGNKLGYKVNQMQSRRENEFVPKVVNWDKVRSKTDVKMLQKTLKKQTASDYYETKDEIFKMNYIQGLYNEFGSKADALVYFLQDVPAADIVKKYHTDTEASIKFIYEPFEAKDASDNDAVADAKFDAIANVWIKDMFGDPQDPKSYSIK